MQKDSRNPENNLTIQKRHEKESSIEKRGSSEEGFSVHVSNLPYCVDKEHLKNAFREFGAIKHSHVNLDEIGRSRGFGVVEFETKEAADKAVEVMDKAEFNKREVSVRAHH